MARTRSILADVSAGISELQKNPLAVLQQGHGAPVVILHHDEPAFYAVPAELYEMLLDKLEDVELAELVRSREGQPDSCTVMECDSFSRRDHHEVHINPRR